MAPISMMAKTAANISPAPVGTMKMRRWVRMMGAVPSLLFQRNNQFLNLPFSVAIATIKEWGRSESVRRCPLAGHGRRFGPIAVDVGRQRVERFGHRPAGPCLGPSDRP